ncbi:efflux RND transporter permease subunit [Roseicella aquatilis]|uniref:Efflux RND transporter permease subunit n=1 Tax=Roseicella aquatilis TaxID=2527868 RepID=A0A4R4D3T4_9PROT|nr:CusA/CzcA family heavy metal efflux RND transporter [Roseicella aquatilis]TCZ53414.1 efflux RND transporter permease subunit [Roseicella aquatilis]
MLTALADLALRQRLIALLAALGLAAWGWSAYRALPIDAFPDVAPTQVLVSMRAPGLAPEELESRVTVPVELAMKGIPNLARMRSTTRFSVTLMVFEFHEGTDIFWARAQVNERLAQMMGELPAGVSGGLAPIVTPLAEMLMFTIEGGDLTAEEQRTLVDWTIRPVLRRVPGVADVNVLGGHVRTYEVVPNPTAMAARSITTQMLEAALEANNRNDGAGRVPDGEEALLVRIEDRFRTMGDIRATVVTARDGRVVRVSDVADVRFGALPRNGVVTRDGEGEAVWGLVLGLRGANARAVVEGVKARMPEIERQMPAGARVVFFYDRAELITGAVNTVQRALIEAIVLVSAVLLLFLGNLRLAVVVCCVIPLAVLFTFALMPLFGLTANIMSLGGIVIAIGLLVDCPLVVAENVANRIQKLGGRADLATRLRLTRAAMAEVAGPLAASILIIVMVFVPLLSLQGLEGRLFTPVALTITFGILAAFLLSLTVVPILCATLLGRVPAREPWLVRRIRAGYEPFLGFCLRQPLLIGGVTLALLVAAFLVFGQIGKTFMPVMDEGTPVVTVRKHPTISVEEAAETDLRIQRKLLAIPEIRGVIARAGADELGIDPVGLNETDMMLRLAPVTAWRAEGQAGGTPWLLGEVRRVLDGIPGISFAFSQPIDMRVQEMIIGARGDVVVKVFGPEIVELNRLAGEVAQVMSGIPGASDVFALRNEGMKYLTIRTDRLAAGRFGLEAQDVQETVRVWVDGRRVGLVLEPGAIRVPLAVRGEEATRRSAIDLTRVPLALPGGGMVQLGQVASIREEEGPVQVIREDAQRFQTVLSNVRGRDLVGFVEEARVAVERGVTLPQGYSLVWGGQFENQQRAAARLGLVVPIALGVIFLILYMTFGSMRQAALVFCNVPFAMIGGVFGLWLSGEWLSVPASVGFIALIGIGVMNGVVLVSYAAELVAQGLHDVREAARAAANRRMTPVLLTAATTALGLMPFLFATGPGSEIQRPLATVVIGGLVTSTLLTLVLLPILFGRFGMAQPRPLSGLAEDARAVAPQPMPAGNAE